MKTEEEIKQYFFEMLESCFTADGDASKRIYYIYNPDYVMVEKLNSLVDKKDRIENKKEITKNSYALFRSFGNGWFEIDYKNIWCLIGENITPEFENIKKLTKQWLKEYFHKDFETDCFQLFTPISLDRLNIISYEN